MRQRKTGLIVVLATMLMISIGLSGIAVAHAEPTNEVMSAEEFREATLACTSSIPENAYGGEYIDEAGNLVIHIKDGASIPPITGVGAISREKIKIRTVEYSLAELETMKEALVPYMLDYDIASLDANEVTTTIDFELWNERDDLYSLIERMGVIDMDIVRITVLEDVSIEFTVAEYPSAQISEAFLVSTSDVHGDAIEQSQSRVTTTI